MVTTAMDLTAADMVSYLLEKRIGRRRIALLTNQRDQWAVDRWATGEAQPSWDQIAQIRVAYETFKAVVEAIDDRYALAWFTDSRVWDDRTSLSPLHAIRVGIDRRSTVLAVRKSAECMVADPASVRWKDQYCAHRYMRRR